MEFSDKVIYAQKKIIEEFEKLLKPGVKYDHDPFYKKDTYRRVYFTVRMNHAGVSIEFLNMRDAYATCFREKLSGRVQISFGEYGKKTIIREKKKDGIEKLNYKAIALHLYQSLYLEAERQNDMETRMANSKRMSEKIKELTEKHRLENSVGILHAPYLPTEKVKFEFTVPADKAEDMVILLIEAGVIKVKKEN